MKTKWTGKIVEGLVEGLIVALVSSILTGVAFYAVIAGHRLLPR